MPISITQLKIKFREACTIPVVSLFLIPLVHFPFLHFSFTPAKELTFKIILLLGLTGLLLRALKETKMQTRRVGDSLLFLLLLSELALHALSNFLSPTPLVALYGTFSRGGGFIFELYLFAFLIWNALFLNRETLHKVLKWFWAGALVVALYAYLQKLGVDFFFQNYSTNLFQGRVFSFLGNPSLLGQFTLLSVLAGFYLFVRETHPKLKAVFASGTLVMLGALLLSGTRAAVLGLLGITFLAALKYRKEIWQIIKKLGVKILLVVPLLGLLLWAAPSGRFDLSALSLRSLHSRFEIWEGTVQLIKKSWLLGYGQETFYVHFPEIVSKDFLTLEEDLSISADRVHNEWLEEIYNHGVPAGLLYLVLLAVLLKKFFKSQRHEEVLLAGLILANSLQNQLSFPDPSIQVLMAFAWGALVGLESKETEIKNPIPKKGRRATVILSFILLAGIAFQTVGRPLMAHRLYTVAHKNASEDYAVAVNALKASLAWTPYYSETWYELMFIDPSSMERALANLEVIDGESGDVLAWKGNFYAESDPQLSAEYFIQALEKNPSHPNWLRAFGDMLYLNGDCETALYIYEQYLEVVPDYWRWSVDLDAYTEAQQRSYETFFKHVPYFFGTLEKIEVCQATLSSDSTAQ